MKWLQVLLFTWCLQFVSRLFVLAFKIVVELTKIYYVNCYTSYEMTDQFFYDFSFKRTATAGIGIHPTKAWLSQLVNFKNAIWTLEERYAIKLCFKLGKKYHGMLQTAFRLSCMNRALVFEWHKRFKEGRESVRDDERCGRSKEVNAPEFMGHMVRVRVTMLRF